MGSNELRNEQITTEDNDDDEILPPVPPDGGWGWIVVVASCLANLIIDGICYSFGIFLVDFQEYFDSSKAKTALIGSLLPGTYFLVGPLVSALSNKFGCKSVAICGGIIAGASFFISTFSVGINMMLVVYGVIGGIGFGLIYLPSIVMVGMYFNRRRALATGIAVCGSGIGTFVFAPLSRFLLDTYGWKGANWILAAILLHTIPCGACYRALVAYVVPKRPLSNIIQKILATKKRNRTISSGSLDGAMITRENKLLLKQQIVTIEPIVELPHEEENRSSSTIGEMDFKTDDLKVDYLTVPENRSLNTSTYSIPVNRQLDRVKQSEITPSSKVSSRRESTTGSVSCRSQYSISTKRAGEDTESLKKQLSRPMYRLDVLYTGSIVSLKEYRTKQDMMSYVQSITTIPTEDADAGPVCNVLKVMFDFSLIKSITFIILCCSGVFVFMGYFIPFIYITDYATMQGIALSKASLLISVIGVLNTLGRLIAGWLADRPCVDSLYLHNLAAIFAGFLTCLLPLCVTYELMVIYSALFGLCIASFIALRSIVIVELLGLDKLNNAFGLMTLFQGIAILVGSPLAGIIFDLTGSYTWSFIISGLLIQLGGFVCLTARRISLWERSRETRKQAVQSIGNDSLIPRA